MASNTHTSTHTHTSTSTHLTGNGTPHCHPQPANRCTAAAATPRHQPRTEIPCHANAAAVGRGEASVVAKGASRARRARTNAGPAGGVPTRCTQVAHARDAVAPCSHSATRHQPQGQPSDTLKREHHNAIDKAPQFGWGTANDTAIPPPCPHCNTEGSCKHMAPARNAAFFSLAPPRQGAHLAGMATAVRRVSRGRRCSRPRMACTPPTLAH